MEWSEEYVLKKNFQTDQEVSDNFNNTTHCEEFNSHQRVAKEILVIVSSRKKDVWMLRQIFVMSNI